MSGNKRNDKIVGKNSASYNDKHPERPVKLGGIIRTARRNAESKEKVTLINQLANLPRPEIEHYLAKLAV